jgi:ubiquinone biosynthesis protein
VRLVGRLGAIAWQLGRTCALLAWRLGLRRARRRPTPTGDVLGRTLADAFQALGPTYVKLGQVLSSRADLLGPEVARGLERLVDRLPPGPFSVVPATVAADLGLELDEAFSAFEREPLASASLACVYRATLHDGRRVAVKVRRHDVAERIVLDLRMLQAAARLAERLPPLRALPLEASIAELGRCIADQLDLRREADAHRRLRDALRWEPELVIPELVDELCGEAVLTMELLDGLQRDDRPDRTRAALVVALNALYRMIFVEGLVHCDLHAGNLHFLPDGRVAIIDFGFVAELPYEHRLRFAEFFYALATDDGALAAEVTLELAASTPPGFDPVPFAAEIAALVRRSSGRGAHEFLVAGFAAEMFAIQRRHRVRGTTAFTMAIVALLVFEGIVRDVAPDLDFQERAKPFIFRTSLRGASA